MKIHAGLYAHKPMLGSLEFFWGMAGGSLELRYAAAYST
jgi:hypothetical protein